MQDALHRLSEYWNEHGCLTVQPFNTEVGAGTMNPATVLRVLGPEPWNVAYVEPSVRPDDSRYGENPNRLQTHTQFQVILKPDPGNPQELYLGSLAALGIDLAAHDVRFVEDNWAQPAIGAWGLGWEVWLDGMEITQFTYFQQVGGQNLAPIPVELTYGMERILMAVQGVTHFKDIVYATASDGSVISYGEAFGQQEYEMSRYYLDDADVDANRSLYRTYVGEATRMVEARLPVPAHYFILKSSHAFNVLDARGAISTTERAQAFATMRRLMRDTAELWIARREELGLPLLNQTAADQLNNEVELPRLDPSQLPETPQTFALEIGVEELPPHVVSATIEQVRETITTGLRASRLTFGEITVDATPRRIVATVEAVGAYEPETTEYKKGPKWSVAFDKEGNPTKAVAGFARGQGVSTNQLVKMELDGVEYAAVALNVAKRPAYQVLSNIVETTVLGLRAAKNMRWNDPNLTFSRAIRWLVALWGPIVVPAKVSQLVTGRTTYLQRGTGSTRSGIPLGHQELAEAELLRPKLAQGAIIVNLEQRRAEVIRQAAALVADLGTIDFEYEASVIAEITNLVEAPHGVLGSFDAKYLNLPELILTTVMRKHQRYLPIRDADGRLAPYFVTMANGECDDDLVRAGNESVLRARFEDALFFWETDLKANTADAFVPGLAGLTFETRIGSMGQRAARISATAKLLADTIGLEDRATLDRAGELAKFDLATNLVVEMSSLAGFVAREYASRLGEKPAVSQALYEMELPHTAADALPVSTEGALLSLADRFDLLLAMFALGAKPTGSSDPYGLRRAALGVCRVLRDQSNFKLSVADGLAAAAMQLRDQGVEVNESAISAAQEFIIGRFAQLLRDEGSPAELVAAVLPGAGRPNQADQALSELKEMAFDQQFRSLVTSLVRIDRIVPAGTNLDFDSALLNEPAEIELVNLVNQLSAPGSTVREFTDQHRVLVAPISRFFDEILVMDEDLQVRAARLGLLATILARVPAILDLRALDIALN